MASNLERTLASMAAKELPAMLVTDMGNIRWLTGFTGSFGVVVLQAEGCVLITDSRYSVQAREQVTNMEVVIYASPQRLNQVLAQELEKRQVVRMGFEPSVTVSTWEDWRKDFPKVELVLEREVIPNLRMVKSADEVEAIRQACVLADACFAHVLPQIKVGVVEYDLALEVEFFFRRHRAPLAFEVISVSGPNSAKPHGRPSERKFEPGDFLTLDFGCGVNGYFSDITRTVVIGEATPRHELIYNRVLESQVAAIEALRPGANGREVDALVRSILDKDDLSKYFGHGLGHGLGSAVHDVGRLSAGVSQPIEVGQVWTVEPGVYIDGWGGVRIEDDIVITPEGCEVLTHSPKQLMVVS